jgi:hypothetical protein
MRAGLLPPSQPPIAEELGTERLWLLKERADLAEEEVARKALNADPGGGTPQGMGVSFPIWCAGQCSA